MRPRASGLTICAALTSLGLTAGLTVEARELSETVNPVQSSAITIREGSILFRSNCAPCHGFGAVGGTRGPALNTSHWTHGSADHDLFRTITRGVAGTQMPANDLEDGEVWRVIIYLRSLAPVTENVHGNAAKGEMLFLHESGCIGCHMVHGRGGALGPDLSRVGSSRSVAYLIESIRAPSQALSVQPPDPNDHYGLPPEYDTVTAVLHTGETIAGVARNEDPFSLQMIDTKQNLRLLLKSELREVRHEEKSLMPTYSREMLSDAQLNDVVAYLETLD